MKILMIGTYPLGKIYGGVPTYTYNFAHYLGKRNDVELHVITFGDESKEIKDNNITVHVINKKFFPLMVPLGIWRLLRIAARIKPDIVNVIGTHFPNPILALLLRRTYRVTLTVIATISLEKRFYEIGRGYYGTSLYQLFNLAALEKLAVAKVENVIVETPNVKRLLSKWTKARIHVIPDGVEYEKIQGIAAKKENIDVLFVGRLVKVKGIDVLIRGISTVKKSFPEVNLAIIGYGPREDALKALVKELGLEENVRFLGFLSEEEKFRYFKACEVVAIPSRWENSPITLYEAMAASKAVVASNVSGIPDVLIDGETGYLFESENAKQLAKKITILLKDEKLRNAMGRAAGKKAREYDWKNIADKTVEVYGEIIDSTRT